jgi:hypothetical protein
MKPEYKSRIAVSITATCFTIFLAKSHLEWIPDWMLLLPMGAAGIYWLAFEPSVREVYDSFFHTEAGRILDPSTHRPLCKPKLRVERAIVTVVVVMGISLALGWALATYRAKSNLPKEADRARLIVTSVSFLTATAQQGLPFNVNFTNPVALPVIGVEYSYGVLPSNIVLSDTQLDIVFDEVAKGARESLGKQSDQIQLNETRFFTGFGSVTETEVKELHARTRVLYLMIIFEYHDEYGRRRTEYCSIFKEGEPEHKCNAHNMSESP